LFVYNVSSHKIDKVAYAPGADYRGTGASISGDGRFLAFAAVVEVVGVHYINVYRYDCKSKNTRQVNGKTYGAADEDASISSDGRFVAFSSRDNDLIANDKNGRPDVFVHDVNQNKTTRVSVSSKGIEANNDSMYPVISGDGRYVAFTSLASNLTGQEDTNSTYDVFLHDRFTGETRLVSHTPGGAAGSDLSRYPSISEDGRIIAFMSNARDLDAMAPDSPSYYDAYAYAYDTASGEVRVASITEDAWPFFVDIADQVLLSGNGQYLGVSRWGEAYLCDLGRTLTVPHYVNGLVESVPNRSRFVLRNGSGYPEQGQFRFRDSNGMPTTVSIDGGQVVSWIDYALPPWGVYEVKTDGTGPLVTGSVEVSISRGLFSSTEATVIFDVLGRSVSLDSCPIRSRHSLYVSVNDEEHTGLAVFNPGPKKAKLKFGLTSSDSRESSEKPETELELEAGKKIAVFVDDSQLFKDYLDGKVAGYKGTLSLLSQADAPVAVVGLIQRKDSGALIDVAAGGWTEGTAADNYRLPSTSPALVFPHFLHGTIAGVPSRTRLIFLAGKERSSARVSFSDNTGKPLVCRGGPLIGDTFLLNVPRLSGLELETESWGPPQAGTIEVKSYDSDWPLEGIEVFDVLGNYVTVGNCPARATHQIFASHNADENTGMAIYNVESSPVTVWLRLLNAGGQQVSVRSVELEPKHQTALFLDASKLFGDYLASASPFVGTVNITTDNQKKVSVVGLVQRRDNGALMAVRSGATAFAP